MKSLRNAHHVNSHFTKEIEKAKITNSFRRKSEFIKITTLHLKRSCGEENNDGKKLKRNKIIIFQKL